MQLFVNVVGGLTAAPCMRNGVTANTVVVLAVIVLRAPINHRAGDKTKRRRVAGPRQLTSHSMRIIYKTALDRAYLSSGTKRFYDSPSIEDQARLVFRHMHTGLLRLRSGRQYILIAARCCANTAYIIHRVVHKMA